MEPDFIGYATKAGLRCSDGRTIAAHAFRLQDQTRVPLVWQHGHSDPENVIGHAILEDLDDGVRAYAFFNNTAKAKHARESVIHGDIDSLSIWANDLMEKAGRVIHGVIREVSLVLSGANPGAKIDPVSIRHSDGTEDELLDTAVIYTGLPLVHGSADDIEESSDIEDDDELTDDELQHADTVQEVYDEMTDEQKKVLHYLVGLAAEGDDGSEEDDVKQDSLGDTEDDDHLSHDNSDEEGTTEMTKTHNVFEGSDTSTGSHQLSHDAIRGIMADATRSGSVKDAVETYALAHGITDIDQLFPDPQTLGDTPEFLARRTEWVDKVFGGTRKSPFNRIRTLSADITEDEARAKGYVTGALKKEEFFTVSKRVTTPTTVYKKQKLERDDVVDITDFDVVAWLKAEMRLMLDEEISRAILLGDGRDIAHADKINEQCIRPVVSDHELFTSTMYVNLGDANSTVQEAIDQIVMGRRYYKGSGLPTMFTTETMIARFLLLKDTVGRRIYRNLEELATELRVKEIVPVEVMEEAPYSDVVAVIFNPADYVVGATAGGKIGMFDDFDIDYNQHKYLIETRMCGALTKLKSALVVRSVASNLVLAVAEEPDFDPATGVITIPTVTGVQYEDASDPGVAIGPGALSALGSGNSMTVVAVATSGYYLGDNVTDEWTFTQD